MESLTDGKPAFRKPSNDTIGSRHYRRRSPLAGSSSSEDSAARGSSPIHSREESKRKVDGRDLDRDSGRIHHVRSGDTYKQFDRRRSTYDRRDKVTHVEERHYSKSSSQFGREFRSTTRSDHAREEIDKSRHHSYHDDKYSRIERSEYRRGDKKFSHSPVHGSSSRRDKAGHRLNDLKDLDGQKYAKEEKRKLSDQETRNQMDGSDKNPRKQFMFTTRNEDSSAKRQKPVSLVNEGKALNHSLEPAKKANCEQATASGCNAADIDAARITALKAAESVNKNLMGTGYMSADQKKKLLWGNKKSTPVEESIHRWGTATFCDREQQEKFNKLMGVKVEVKADHKPNDQESGMVHAEKQKEVLLDLEKQYVAGLRRRDGRTVGLGL